MLNFVAFINCFQLNIGFIKIFFKKNTLTANLKLSFGTL